MIHLRWLIHPIDMLCCTFGWHRWESGSGFILNPHCGNPSCPKVKVFGT